jgi:small subunit ribosomal protein S16
MLMIRFQRIGRTNDPAFRIVLLEKERAAKAGGITELLGTYNPKSKALTLKDERVKYWISKGAQPTDSIHNLLISKGVIEGKKRNVLPKKTVAKVEEPAPAAAPAAEAASEPVEVAPEAAAEAPVAEPVAENAEVVTEAPAQTSETESVVPTEDAPTEEQVVAEAEPAPAEAAEEKASEPST